MIGITLSSYFFRRYTATIIRFSITILALVFIVDFTEVSRRSGSNEFVSLLDILYMSALRLPNIVQLAMPFIILFASISVLMALNRRHELVIARSVGVSAWQFLTPMVLASLLTGIVTVVAINPLAALALQKSQDLEVAFGIGNQNGSNETPPFLRQTNDAGTTIISARSIGSTGGILGNATFLQLDGNGFLQTRLEAVHVTLRDGHWHLSDVSRHRAGHPPELLDSLDIPTNLTSEFVAETFTSPEAVPFFELGDKMQTARAFGFGVNALAMQWHALVALPLLLAAMTLIAAMVTLRFIRFGQSVTIILSGILAGFMLYVVSVLIKAFGTAGIVPPVVAAWLPVVIATALGISVLLHKEDG